MASKSQPGNYQGMSCPLEASFAYVHGPSAAVATLKVLGNIAPPLGTEGAFHIGPQTFYGFLTNRQYNETEDVTTLRLVDWRDRLHDSNVFCQLNMQESDGRFFHVLPQDWYRQTRTWITPELPQWNLPAPGIGPMEADPLHKMLYQAGGQLISARLILEGLAAQFDFKLHCESFADEVFTNSFPLNLDGNSGISVAALIDMVLSKSGLIWDVKGKKDLYVHLRGFTENAFIETFKDTASGCAVGAQESDLGEDLNENGRRIKILGDRNRYEATYCCRPNWNPAWTFQLAFGTGPLSALLRSLNLTRQNKLYEMPEEYWDLQTWKEAPRENQGYVDARAIRNSMTIGEYIDKYVFKCFIVDFGKAVIDAEMLKKDGFSGFVWDMTSVHFTSFYCNLQDYPAKKFSDWSVVDKTGLVDTQLMCWLASISEHLVSESNAQSQIYCTSRKIMRGLDNPYAAQLTIVPRNEGASIDFEDMWLGPNPPAPTTGDYYGTITRIFFSQPQFFVQPGAKFMDPGKIQPDLVLVSLCLDWDVFEYIAGEAGGKPRVREKVIPIRNLCESYINQHKMEVIAQNYLQIPGTGGARPVPFGRAAKDIAKWIADCYLYHKYVTTSGSLTFWDRCGMQPDGVIDNVMTSWHAQDGIREVINFNDDNHRDLEIVLPVMLNVSRRLDQEERLIKDNLIAIALAGRKKSGTIKGVMAVMDAGLHEPGALYGTPLATGAVGRAGVVSIGIENIIFDAHPIPAGAPLPVGKPAPPPPVPPGP